MRQEMFIYVAPWGTDNFVEITQFIANQGLKWSRNDVDAPNSGRECQNGLLYRKRVAQKKRLDITCRPLKQTELTYLLNAINPEWLAVRYWDALAGEFVTKKMYNSTVPATFFFDDGINQYWTGVEFPLIEQ